MAFTHPPPTAPSSGHDRASFLEASGDCQTTGETSWGQDWIGGTACLSGPPVLSGGWTLPHRSILGGCWAGELETKGVPTSLCPVGVAVLLSTEQHPGASRRVDTMGEAWPPFFCGGGSLWAQLLSYERELLKI